MAVSGNPLAWSREKALLQEPKWALQSMAPLPPASAASRCSRPRISTSFPSDRARPRSRITSMTSQESIRKNSLANRSASSGLSSSPSTWRRLHTVLARLSARYRKVQSPRQQAIR